jgi:guanosine-3',5'-bis(diphosphate) 3'-pyrophosphohydrolase
MVTLQDILDQLRINNPEATIDEVEKAYQYSAKVHQGQLRRSGEPYLVHPLSVALIIAELNMDEASVITGLLHDTLEDTLAKPHEIESLFGPTVLFLVEGVTKLSKVSFHSGEERQAENVRKMLVAMSQDLRVIFVKLADRLHNMRTLEYMEPNQREMISRETLEIYAPLANRLGIQWIRTELEDLSFRWLYPEEFQRLGERLDQLTTERRQYIEEVIEMLSSVVKDNEIQATVSGRIKHLYSIFRKMRQKEVDFDQIYDIIAFRIITTSIGDCYRVLGLIHALWKPVVGRFKDYIAVPKINRYQSLHTTVIGMNGERVEIQIRTEEMHRIAEQGIAAHWVYKEAAKGDIAHKHDLSQFAWLRELLDQQKDVKDAAEFLESVKVDLFSDEVFTFTPEGDVKALPNGATALDFAYLVHTEVGHHCVGARVNGKIAPLRQQLKNGDTVEILTNPNQRPSKDWLSFVKTAGARNKIRSVIRAEQRKRSEEIGREILEKECKRRGISLQRVWHAGEIAKVAEALGFKDSEEMLIALGIGKISTTKILDVLAPPEKSEEEPETLERWSEKISSLFKRGKKSKSGILVQGLDDVLIRFGKCCNPIPGDPLVGVITRGRGVTVHTSGCPHVREADPERRIEVRWDQSQDLVRSVGIRIFCSDRPGVLANLTNVISESGLNISKVNARVEDKGHAVCVFRVDINNLDQLHQVMLKIGRIKGVSKVERIQG